MPQQLFNHYEGLSDGSTSLSKATVYRVFSPI